jgi:MFS family permease
MLFLLLGVVFATWAARIPAIRDALQLSPAQLGLVLLCGGLGAVVSFPVAAWLVGHHGARRGAGSSGLMLIAVLPLLALAPNMALLMLSMVLFGTAQTSFNVAINAVGAQAERTAGRSLMSRLHAWYCIGAFGGALLGSGLAGSGVPAAVHFAVVAVLLALPLSLSHRALPFDHPQAPDAAGRFALPKGPLLALGVICFGAAIAEGTITDWSGVYMRDQLGATEGQAPLAFGAFSGLMVGMRLAADRLKDRFGASRGHGRKPGGERRDGARGGGLVGPAHHRWLRPRGGGLRRGVPVPLQRRGPAGADRAGRRRDDGLQRRADRPARDRLRRARPGPASGTGDRGSDRRGHGRRGVPIPSAGVASLVTQTGIPPGGAGGAVSPPPRGLKVCSTGRL